MNKTSRTELRRLFLIENLPAPLTRADRHWQIFDNYLENTRLRLRSIRVPETKEWTWILEQRSLLDDCSQWEVSEILLNETEHAVFEIFEGREIKKNERVETNEIRKNRYFYEVDGKQIEIDMFLGALWGLHLAQVVFESLDELRKYQPPSFAILEVTINEFFVGRNLIGKTFSDVRAEFERSKAGG